MAFHEAWRVLLPLAAACSWNPNRPRDMPDMKTRGERSFLGGAREGWDRSVQSKLSCLTILLRVESHARHDHPSGSLESQLSSSSVRVTGPSTFTSFVEEGFLGCPLPMKIRGERVYGRISSGW